MNSDVPDRLSLDMGGGVRVDVQLTVVPPPPPIPNHPLPVSSSCSVVRRSSSPANELQAKDKSPAANHPVAQSYECPKNQQIDTLVGETSTPTAQDTPPATRIGGPRDSLSVYRARRRGQSAPASPRDCRGWLAKQAEKQRETSHCHTQTDLDTGLGPPGNRDLTIHELLQIVEASTEGGDAHTPPP